jgi:hypothetical protein
MVYLHHVSVNVNQIATRVKPKAAAALRAVSTVSKVIKVSITYLLGVLEAY